MWKKGYTFGVRSRGSLLVRLFVRSFAAVRGRNLFGVFLVCLSVCLSETLFGRGKENPWRSGFLGQRACVVRLRFVAAVSIVQAAPRQRNIVVLSCLVLFCSFSRNGHVRARERETDQRHIMHRRETRLQENAQPEVNGEPQWENWKDPPGMGINDA